MGLNRKILNETESVIQENLMHVIKYFLMFDLEKV